jgi:hypothetical protein
LFLQELACFFLAANKDSKYFKRMVAIFAGLDSALKSIIWGMITFRNHRIRSGHVVSGEYSAYETYCSISDKVMEAGRSNIKSINLILSSELSSLWEK